MLIVCIDPLLLSCLCLFVLFCFCSFTIFLAYICVNKLCYYKNGLVVISPTVTNTGCISFGSIMYFTTYCVKYNKLHVLNYQVYYLDFADELPSHFDTGVMGSCWHGRSGIWHDTSTINPCSPADNNCFYFNYCAEHTVIIVCGRLLF